MIDAVRHAYTGCPFQPRLFSNLSINLTRKFVSEKFDQ